jgi:hypothetical protein
LKIFNSASFTIDIAVYIMNLVRAETTNTDGLRKLHLMAMKQFWVYMIVHMGFKEDQATELVALPGI